MVERRHGGETGVKWVQAYRGDKFWEAHAAKASGRKKLMDAALCRSHTLTPAREGFNDIFPTVDDMKRIVQESGGLSLRAQRRPEVHDAADERPGAGFQFRLPASTDARSRSRSQMYLPMPDGRTTLANFFSPLVNNMEKMFLTGKANYSAGTDPADHRADRRRRGEPVSRADAIRDAAPRPSNISPRANRRSGEHRRC